MSADGTVFLMGPTACGKTELAAALVERFPMAIVSVDSALVYRGMDIGTAKPDAGLLARAPHKMIDVRDPWQPYSASDFARDAKVEIDSIKARGLVPLLVGGTGLYFRAIEGRLAKLPSANPRVRGEIENEAEALGWPAMHDALVRVDPRSAARIEPGDRQRVQRALEVHRITGEPLSSLQREGRQTGSPPALKIALAPRDRKRLAPSIESRFRSMLESGLIDEAETLRANPKMHADLPAMRAVGYRQVLEFLDGRFGRDEMVSRALAATRQLAKRQMTWLRSEPHLHWIWLEDGDVERRAVELIAALPLIQGR